MNDSLTKKHYLKKIELLQKHNKYYYNKNKPIITDQEFDLIKMILLI